MRFYRIPLAASVANSGETCIVCGKSTEGDGGLACRYHEGRRFTLCCPICLQMFAQASDHFARGDHPQTLVQQLIAEMKWKEAGRS